MLTAYLRQYLQGVDIRSRGTHAISNMPMSWRTKAALDRHGLEAPGHRSVQFSQEDADAQMILAMEPDHIRWIEREFPTARGVAATLPAVASWADEWERAGRGGCSVAISAKQFLYAKSTTLDAANMAVVADPAGGEVEQYFEVVDEVVHWASVALPLVVAVTGAEQVGTGRGHLNMDSLGDSASL